MNAEALIEILVSYHIFFKEGQLGLYESILFICPFLGNNKLVDNILYATN